MAWNKLKPAGADKIKDSDNNIRLNNDAIETVLGTNITAGPTSIQDAILGDGTKGRKFRAIYLYIVNGTNASTLKCTVGDRFNGDTIGETDNIAKDATTGNFSLDASGAVLTVEAAGLTGNVIFAFGQIVKNAGGTAATVLAYASGNDIAIIIRDAASGANLDITTLVDTGEIHLDILYITDA